MSLDASLLRHAWFEYTPHVEACSGFGAVNGLTSPVASLASLTSLASPPAWPCFRCFRRARFLAFFDIVLGFVRLDGSDGWDGSAGLTKLLELSISMSIPMPPRAPRPASSLGSCGLFAAVAASMDGPASRRILSMSTFCDTREHRLIIFLLITDASNGDSSSELCTASSLGTAPRMGMLHGKGAKRKRDSGRQ